MRSRCLHALAGAVVLASCAAAAAWASPTVSVDRECYLPDQPVKLNGSGFTPSGAVNVFLYALEHGTTGVVTGQAGPDGSLAMEFPMDGAFLDEGSVSEPISLSANDATLIAQGAGPDTAVGFTTFILSDTGVHVDAWDLGHVNPRARTTFRLFGLNNDLDKRVYAHYLRRGKEVKSVPLGRLKAPCGDLVVKKRQFAFRPVRKGLYTIVFNTEPRFSPATPSVAYPRTVRVTRRQAIP